MWTYLLLCCLAACTVFSSDSRTSSSTTRSNSSLAATSDHLATGLNPFTDFPKPACIAYGNAITTFSNGVDALPNIMVQSSCECCDYDRNQVLIVLSASAENLISRDLMVILGHHVFHFLDAEIIMYNNKRVDLENEQDVTIRDRQMETVADLKRSGSRQLPYFEAQFPQHNITVGYLNGKLIFVHLDASTWRKKTLGGMCGQIVN